LLHQIPGRFAAGDFFAAAFVNIFSFEKTAALN
jgi:hypothetical protein